jgi:carbamoyltransferase
VSHYLGLGGIAGLDPVPAKHIAKYARSHPEVGIALGDIGHDATAAVIKDGKVVFAVEEERLNRSKHFMGLPAMAIAACEQRAGVSAAQMKVSYYLNPSDEHRARRVKACSRFVDPAAAQAVDREFQSAAELIRSPLSQWPSLRMVDHHRAHAASAFYPSAFERALVLIADGQGESDATTLFLGDAEGLRPLAQLPVTGSLGYLYSDVTAYLGFEAIEDEYKIMGLAAYGESDDYRKFFDGLIHYEEDGTFTIPSLLDRAMKRLHDWSRALGPPRRADTPIEPRHIAIAHSLQKSVERAVLRLLEQHASKHGVRHLCIAGGVGLNCSMNGVIDRSGMFDSIFVQPAAVDSGAALGSAFAAYYADHPDGPRPRMDNVYFGPSFTEAEVKKALDGFAEKVSYTRPEQYTDHVATALAAGKIVGWFQGRMEFGPRALGNRSILADPRPAEMKDHVNKAVKKREEFRPFAPSVAAEHADAFFELRAREPYESMTVAVKAKPERAKEIGAVVHVNGTARVHLVRPEVNPRYHELINAFGRKTQVPVVLNTSFNVKGEPIVCTPEDAIRCFLGTGIDHLAIEGFWASKR